MFITTNQEALSPVEQTTSLIVSLIIIVLAIIAYWKMFTKAGQAGWKFLLFCIPVVNIIYYIIFSLRMAKAYGKGTGFGIGLIFLNALFTLILGFGSASYVGPKGQAQA